LEGSPMFSLKRCCCSRLSPGDGSDLSAARGDRREIVLHLVEAAVMQQPVAAAMNQGTSAEDSSGNQIRKRSLCLFSCWLSMANETGGGWKANYPCKLRKPVDCFVHHRRRTRPRFLLNCKEMVLLYFKSSYYIWISCKAAGHTVSGGASM
jgi:hypothetical protein